MDLGDYESCKWNKDMSYSFVYGKIDQVQYGTIFMGLCLDRHCNANVLNQMKGDVVQFMIDLGMIDQNSQDTGDKLSFAFAKPNPEYDFGFCFTIVLIGILLFLCLYLPVKYLIKTLKEKKITFQHIDVEVTNAINLQAQVNINNKEQTNTKQQITWAGKIFECFSVTNNIRNFLQLKKQSTGLKILNAFKFFAFLQIIFYHVNIEIIEILPSNSQISEQYRHNSKFQKFSQKGNLAVDVFLFLGGLLLSYVSLEPEKLKTLNCNNPIIFVKSLIHRLFRILPSIFFMVFIFWKLTNHLGSGPLWELYLDKVKDCNVDNQGGWITRVLFIDNLVTWGSYSTCLSEFWYLSVDMQLFLVFTLILGVYNYSKIICKSLIWMLFLLCTFVSMDPHYSTPQIRVPVYSIGILLGMQYREYQNEKHFGTPKCILGRLSYFLNKYSVAKWGLYVIGLILINVVIWRVDFQLQNERWQSYIEGMIFRNLYVIGVGLLALPCMLGCSDFYIKFVTHDAFSYLSKVTYTGYVIHRTIIYITTYNWNTLFQINYYTIFSLTIYIMILSMFFGALMTICVEISFINLGMLVMGEKKKQQQQQLSQKNNKEASENK